WSRSGRSRGGSVHILVRLSARGPDRRNCAVSEGPRRYPGCCSKKAPGRQCPPVLQSLIRRCCDAFLPHLEQFVSSLNRFFISPCIFFSVFGLKHCRILASNEGKEVIL